jgi:spore coat protein CotH
MALEDLLGFSDAYMTLADNYYLYNDPKNPGRMIYIPSDLDTTIGTTVFELDLMLSGDYAKHPGFNLRPLTRHLFSNPDILQKYKNTILKLAKELVHPSIMMPRIDSVVNMIYTDVEWDQSLERMGKNLERTLETMPVKQTGIPPGMKKTNDFYSRFPFNQSVNGPLNNTNVESVKGFINRKIDAVLAFYKE